MPPSCTEILDRFRRGDLAPSTLLEQTLATIDALDDELGAFVSVDREAARQQAAEADRRWRAGTAGPLCGVPLSVKDILDVAGYPTGCGSPNPRQPAQKDAAVVARLQQAGAIVVGKVHLHELALGITGENPRLGTPKNPRDPSRLPGGSSSGSAVSVAAGMVPASIGTDTGGSARVPAALCGVVGFKPSFGRISRAGVAPLARSMDHVGVLAGSVADARLLLSVLEGQDPEDPHTLGVPRERESSVAARRPRAALLQGAVGQAATEVRRAVVNAVDRLQQAGQLVVEPVELALDQAVRTYRTLLVAEAATTHAEALRRGERFGDDVQLMLEQGAGLPATRYVEAMGHRLAFAVACDQMLQDHDCLALPTTLVPAPPVGSREVRTGGKPLPVRAALVGLTCPFSMVGLPALSLPCGSTPDGLPVGLQLVGRRHGDMALLELAQRVQYTLTGPAAAP